LSTAADHQREIWDDGEGEIRSVQTQKAQRRNDEIDQERNEKHVFVES